MVNHAQSHAEKEPSSINKARYSPVISKSKPFHTGYYNHTNGRTFSEMANCLIEETEFDEEVDGEDCPYDSAADFLQGSCQLFSLALHKAFGFEAFEIWRGKDFHCFCKSSYQGIPVYTDVRGATTDFDEFIAGTAYIKHDYDKIIAQDLVRDAQLNGDWDDVGFSFAQKLIHEHPEYYNVGNP